MNRLIVRTCFALAVALIAPTATSAATVDFDNAQGDAALFIPQGTVDIQGLTFSYPGFAMPGAAYVWDGNSPNSNGTNNLILGFSPNDPVTITRTGGGLFNLASIDLAISWFSLASTANILVNGNPLAINQTLTTYALGLTNVSSVTITGIDTNDGYWTADNLQYRIGAVPEPATLMLLGIAAAGGALRRRHQQSQARLNS